MTMPAPSPVPVDSKLIDRLRKILALTQSPNENEAASAADMLQRFLTDYNLSVADLEQKGSKHAAPITESGVDLGKAAFRWKLDLAEGLAEHYFCVGIVDRIRKSVTFVGRPDNVESLKLLYFWVVDQIKRLATAERRRHQAESGEHIDPLRWQVNFGEGAGRRLVDRLEVTRRKQQANAATTALVLHHSKEISDYTEQKYNRRFDGQDTVRDLKWQKENEAYWAKREAEEKRQEEEDSKLLATDPDAYYRQYPSRHPDILLAEQRREARNAARRATYTPRGRYRSYDYDKEEQADTAHRAGRRAADQVNLEPFLTGNVAAGSLPRKGKGK